MGLAIAGACSMAVGCALFVMGGRHYDSALERTFGYSFFVMAFGCAVLWIILFRGTWFTNWLNLRPLQFVGKISYGLYLFQMPVYVLLSHVRMVVRDRPDYWSETLVGSFIVAITCVVVATLSWYLFEQPILRLKDRLAPRG